MAEFLGLKKEALIQKCKDLNLPHEGKSVEVSKATVEETYNPSPAYLEFLREKQKVKAELKIKKIERETALRNIELRLQEVEAERLQLERARLKREEKRKERNPDFKHEFPQVEPAAPENKPLGILATNTFDTFSGTEREQDSHTPVSVKENSKRIEKEKNVRSLIPQKEMPMESFDVWMKNYIAKEIAAEKARYEEFLKYQLEKAREKTAELPQHPGVTITSNKPVLEGTTTEVTVEVENEKEVSEISLQSPENEQASADLSIVSKEFEHVYAEEISIATQLDTKGTVEVSGVGTENSKVNLTDPVKENPEKLQRESILLGEEVEAKESRAQNTVLKEDIALQKEQKEIDDGVTETNGNTKERTTLSEVLIPCQTTEPLVAKRKAVLQNWEVLPEATYFELRQLTEVKQLDKQREDTLHELCIFLRNVTYKLAMDKRFRVFAKPIYVHKVPDYVTVIKQPMDLICSSALEYNSDRDPEHCLIKPRNARLVNHFPDKGNNKTKQQPSREDQSQDGCSVAVQHGREDDDLSPADFVHPRDDLSPADFKHPGDDLSPADGQPRDDINLKEDIT